MPSKREAENGKRNGERQRAARDEEAAAAQERDARAPCARLVASVCGSAVASRSRAKDENDEEPQDRREKLALDVDR